MIALDASKISINKIALSLTEVIRPDIYQNIKGYFLFKKLFENAKKKAVNFKDLKPQEQPQSKLSKQLEVRARNIHYGIGQVLSSSLDEAIYLYELDLRPDREIQTWEIMNLCFLELIDRHKIKGIKVKRVIAELLVGMSLGYLSTTDLITQDKQLELYQLWQKYSYEY